MEKFSTCSVIDIGNGKKCNMHLACETFLLIETHVLHILECGQVWELGVLIKILIFFAWVDYNCGKVKRKFSRR